MTIALMNRSFLWRWQMAIFGFLAMGLGVMVAQETSSQIPTNIWSVSLGYHNESSPALDTNGNIYVTTVDGKLFALHSDGTTRWQYKFGFETTSTPAIASDGAIYFGCRNRYLYAVDDTGKLRWRFKTGGWVDASPALGADGTIYFGSWDKKLYALDQTGKPRWEFVTGAPITSSAAIDRAGVIYFGSHDRKFYALHPDGTKKWEFATGGAILSSPAIGADGALYFTSTDGNLRILNADGSLRWQLHTGGINPSSPVLGNDGAIFVCVNTNYCEVSAEGKLLWSRAMSPNGYPAFDWLVSTPVALEDGTLLTTGTDLFLSIYIRGGAGRWHKSLRTGIRASPLLTDAGTIYCAATGTGLRAFTNCPRPAASSWPMFRANPQRTGRVSAAP